MRSAWLALLLLLPAAGAAAPPALLPWPQQVEWRAGSFLLRQVTVGVTPGSEDWATPVRDHLRALGALAAETDPITRVVHVTRDPQRVAFARQPRVAPTEVILAVSSAAGVRHALQTLRQLAAPGPDGVPRWPGVYLRDAPAYAWRGTMLDVSRHFYSVEFLERYLDELARLKLNVFHWHLTDDQGWRVEVKKHPRLTQVGAWRVEAGGERYGGYYTQEQVAEIVRYAGARGIDVVPEIEFPGHCTAALAAYPHLSCRQETLAVPAHWGVFQDVYCVGRESTWRFLQDVLDELLPLFPSPWVHIGGDEVPPDRWRACPACQQRLREEGLPDEEALQAWAIRRMQAYLRERGKQLVGWDEILEGGLDRAAVVEVWRGDEPARRARANANRMIRTLYFNTSPATLKLDDLLRYDPRVDGSDSLVLGSECPVWSEAIDERNIGYLVFPRLQAFAERLWTAGEPRGDLRARIAPQIERLERDGWITAREDRDLFTARLRYDPARRDWRVTAARGRPDVMTRFSTADSVGCFTDSMRLARPGWLFLAPVWRGRALQNERAYRIETHLGLGAIQSLSLPPSPKYGLDPAHGLSDGLRGTDDFRDGLWQGWEGTDLTVTLDLGRVRQIRSLGIRCLQSVTYWILLPRSVTFQVSDDGEAWRSLPTVAHDLPVAPGEARVHDFAVTLPRAIDARYVRASLMSAGPMPPWHLGAGGASWIFADEFVVR